MFSSIPSMLAMKVEKLQKKWNLLPLDAPVAKTRTVNEAYLEALADVKVLLSCIKQYDMIVEELNAKLRNIEKVVRPNYDELRLSGGFSDHRHY